MSAMKPNMQLIHLVSERLERISADSTWAHRASGVRGALLRVLEEARGPFPTDQTEIKNTLSLAFKILEQAAKRI
jgi:hypothetical protein